MRCMKLGLVAGALVASVLVVAPARAAVPAAEAGLEYVALGDSYSAAPLIAPPPGRPGVREDPGSCTRSWNNYPAFLAGWLDVASYTDVTCSGAQVSDFFTSQGGYAAPQVDALSESTDVVTIGIGGNDYGLFGTMIDTCGRLADEQPRAKAPCRAYFTVDGVDTKKRDARLIWARVSQAVHGVTAAAPNADVFVVGYPRLLPPGARTCDAVGFAAADVAWGNRIANLLNQSLRGAAEVEGATYVDTYAKGHHACAGADAWITGADAVWDGPLAGASFHPNRAGERAMAKAVYRQITGDRAPAGVNAAPPTDAIVLNPAYPG